MYAEGYSLAESFYSASPYLSWMDVVIGDPKCRMIDTRYSSGTGGTSTAPTTYTFNPSRMASGIYFSVLESAGERVIQRMLLTK